jgi:hypothetical protein
MSRKKPDRYYVIGGPGRPVSMTHYLNQEHRQNHALPIGDDAGASLAAFRNRVRPPMLADEFPCLDMDVLRAHLPALPWLHSGAFRIRPEIPVECCKMVGKTNAEVPAEFQETNTRYLQLIDQNAQVLACVQYLDGRLSMQEMTAKVTDALPLSLSTFLWGMADWPGATRSELFRIATNTTLGAYIMAHHHFEKESEWLRIQAQLESSPRMVYFLSRLPHLPETIFTLDWFLTKTRRSPIYYALARWELQFQGLKETMICREIVAQADENIEAAAMALTLEPAHAHAATWLKRISQSPWWALETAHYLTQSMLPDKWVEYSRDLKAAVVTVPRLTYFWYTEIEPWDTNSGLHDLVPSVPWLLELTAQSKTSPSILVGILDEIDHDVDPYWIDLGYAWIDEHSTESGE